MTSIQYINNCSLLIYTDENILLTDPCINPKIPSFPTCIHPAYLISLAEENKNNFSILISNPNEGYCDDEYLKLFPKDINIIIPKYESDLTLNSPFFIRINRLGFNNIIEIDEKQKTPVAKFRTHDGGVISIETEDSLIIHPNENIFFSESCAISIDKHIESYKARATHLEYDKNNIILATRLDTSQDLTRSMNELFISSINMHIKHFFLYGGSPKEFKSYVFYKKIVKEHLFNGINFINIKPGDIFDFKKVKSLFNKFKYSPKSLDSCIYIYENKEGKKIPNYRC